ncbi:hypothetical protein, partial [Streptococcus sobrinus]|uniref:hypothetical protein n=1 Tax=Streptococcus sobrinus TaxID=1310 RepID=UPI00038148F3
ITDTTLGITTAGIVMSVAVIFNIKEEIKGAVIKIGHIAVKDSVAKTLAVMKDGVHAVIQIIFM